jgi:hypothetical protein
MEIIPFPSDQEENNEMEIIPSQINEEVNSLSHNLEKVLKFNRIRRILKMLL